MARDAGKLTDEANIVLIGMPGVGKSTIGVLLAKPTSRGFIDTDLCIQATDGRPLQEIIDADGLEAFCRLEQRCVLNLACRCHVIATGGSVIYSPAAMEHLRSSGPVIHLDLPLDLLERRITNLAVRGVVMEPGQTFQDLFHRRQPLYRNWADLTIDCAGRTHDQVVTAIIEALALGRR